MDWLQNYGKDAAAITAIAGAIVGMWRYVVRPTVALHRETRETNEIVRRELTPNGGSSVRDMVARIDLRLTANEARSRALMEQSGLAFFESDKGGLCVFASRNLCNLAQRTPDELEGLGWLAIVHSEDRAGVAAEWDACVKQRREFAMSFRVVSLDEHQRAVVAQGIVMRDNHGHYIGMVGVLQDHAELRKSA